MARNNFKTDHRCIQSESCGVRNRILDKGVFSKPSGKRIVATFFLLFFELETSNFGYLLIF